MIDGRRVRCPEIVTLIHLQTIAGKDYFEDSDESDSELPMFFDPNLNAITVGLSVPCGGMCGEDREGCCRPTRTNCTVTKIDYITTKRCTRRNGIILCPKEGWSKREAIQTCPQLKAYTRRKAEEQKKKRAKTNLGDTFRSQKKQESKEKTEESSDSMEDSDYSSYDEEPTRNDKISRSKHVTELSHSDLEKLVKVIHLPKPEEKKNPKCKKKKSAFR